MSLPPNIRLLFLDVDGVLTDGSLLYTGEGETIKRFNVRDGLGIKLWQSAGRHIAIISARSTPAVSRRMADLGVTLVRQGIKDKAVEVRAICETLGIPPSESAFMGDDWQDAAAMRLVACAIAPADADPRIRSMARYVTQAPGGRGAVREAIEGLLSAAGLLSKAAASYHLPNADEEST